MSLFKAITGFFKGSTKEDSQTTIEAPPAPLEEPVTRITITTPKVESKNSLTQYENDILRRAEDHGITAKNEKAMLLAQLHHESMGFKRFEESFNYSPERLLAVFPKYVKTLDNAKALVKRGHEAIGNCVYGGRMGNSPTEGWTFRGRGPIQLTGKNNYFAYSKILNMDLVSSPDLVLNKDVGIDVALAFWKNTNGLQVAARAGDVTLTTRLINGGTNGLDDRRKLFQKYLKEI